jgi:predicted nucleic acid-binding protein
MTAELPVLLDACVLANFGVCDLILRLAEPPRLVVPHWSEEILEEVSRTQLGKLKWPSKLVESWRREVTNAFPDGTIVGYEPLLSAMTNHEKDRHVLAAAVFGRMSQIITFNMRDFPAEALEPWNVEAVHPQDYLIALYSISPAVVIAKLAAISRDRQIPLEDVLIRLGKNVPRFSSQVLEEMGDPIGSGQV